LKAGPLSSKLSAGTANTQTANVFVWPGVPMYPFLPPLGDEHRFIVDAVSFIRLPQLSIAFDGIVEQGIAYFPHRLVFVLTHHTFQKPTLLIVGSVIHSIAVVKQDVSGADERDFCHVGKIPWSLS
jgi:hypothetical protein